LPAARRRRSRRALALAATGAVGLLAALVATRELRLAPRWQLAAVAGIAALLLLPACLLQLQVSPYKSLPQTLRISGTQVIAQHTSPLGLLSVVESNTVPLRHAPGLSLYADSPIPRQLGIFTDADGMTAIDYNPGQAPLNYLDQLTSALPYYLTEPRRVLVLGAGSVGIAIAAWARRLGAGTVVVADRVARRRLEHIELVLGRKLGVDHRFATRRAGDEIGEPMVALRSDHEIDMRRAAEDFLALGLGDAAGDGDGGD